MGVSNPLSPSFIEGSINSAHMGATLASFPKEPPKVPQEVCTLIPGLFGIGIQFALCVISVMMLLIKYMFEIPRRPKKVFLMDFIQLMCGSSTVHFLNIISSILINKINVSGGGSFVQDECNMYFMTTVFDATIGVYIEYRIVRYLAIKKAAHNYLQKNRKSKFTPTVQELADATKFATNSLNSLNFQFLVGSGVSSTASTVDSADPLFNFVAPSHKFVGNKLGDPVEGLPTLPSKSFEAKDLEALNTERISTDPPFSERSEVDVKTARSEIQDQFTHDLDDTLTVDDEDDLLIDDTLPNPSFYSNVFLYNLNSIYSKFNKWSKKQANREFLLNLYTWLIIVSGLKCVSILIFTIFSYHINLVTSFLLEPFNNSHRLKLIFVMIISPLFLNVFQYYVTDSIIKIKIPSN